MTRIRPREGLHPAVTKSGVCFDQSGSGDISEIMLLLIARSFNHGGEAPFPNKPGMRRWRRVYRVNIDNYVIGGTRTCGFSRSPGSEREFVTLSVPCKVPRKFPISQPRLISRRNLMYASLQLSNLDYGRLLRLAVRACPFSPVSWMD